MNEHAKWLREQAANDFTCERQLLAAADKIERLEEILSQSVIEIASIGELLRGRNQSDYAQGFTDCCDIAVQHMKQKLEQSK